MIYYFLDIVCFDVSEIQIVSIFREIKNLIYLFFAEIKYFIENDILE